jgi:putative heme-binding domain-containing protein
VEAILYPSVSFVRSYEPVAVMTVDGEVVSGLMVEETVDAVTVIQAADQRVRIKRSDIEEIRPGKTSVMPAGLEQTLSLEELADLIALLESSK